MRVLLALFSVFMFVCGPVMAEAQVGQTFPVELSLKDENGSVQSLESLRGEKGTVLVFVRSVDWCPYCQVQLLDLRSDAGEIVESGYNIVSVSYDASDVLKQFKDKYKFPYAMVSDEGSAVIKELGILNDSYAEDHFAYGVPKPTVYVLAHDGNVQAILAEEGYRKRPQAEVILEAIQSVGN